MLFVSFNSMLDVLLEGKQNEQDNWVKAAVIWNRAGCLLSVSCMTVEKISFQTYIWEEISAFS